MDPEDTFRELIDLKFANMNLKIDHLSQRVDGLISNLKWVIGVVVPVITVVLNAAITEVLQ